jgi:hypothetical protein
MPEVAPRYWSTTRTAAKGNADVVAMQWIADMNDGNGLGS